MTTRTCGECVHWAHGGENGPGACTVSLPWWNIDECRAVTAYESRAAQCDCFEQTMLTGQMPLRGTENWGATVTVDIPEVEPLLGKKP